MISPLRTDSCFKKNQIQKQKMGDKKTEEICNIQDTENGKYSKDKKKE